MPSSATENRAVVESTGMATNGDDYALKRDANASSRLTGQHYLWKDTLGFLLHPSIPTKGPRADPLRVADIATGNGIWLHDLAGQLEPTAPLHGFDISLDQASPPEWLPPNLALHTWSLFDEPPAAFVGYFDVVHVRLITVVVRNNDPTPILASLAKLLKPGGWLQWDEVDSIGCSVKTVQGQRADSLERLLRQLGGTDRWKYHLVETMTKQGWQHPALHCFEYGLTTARFWNDIYVSTWREFAQQVLKTPTESAALEEEAMREVRAGAAIMCPKLVWVAQKSAVRSG